MLNADLPLATVYAEGRWKSPVSPLKVGVNGRASYCFPSTVMIQVLTSFASTVPAGAVWAEPVVAAAARVKALRKRSAFDFINLFSTFGMAAEGSKCP